MIRFIVFIAGLSIACPSSVACAAVISRDWKTPGDGLLTYDDVNRREWLDLTETLLSSQFPGDGATPLEIREARYQYVVSQTVPGGVFDGFTVARSDDVRALAESAGIDLSTSNGAINTVPTLHLSELFGINFVGATSEEGPGPRGTIGLLDEVSNGQPPVHLSALLLKSGGAAGLRFGTHHASLPLEIVPGVMLFRVVPEPDSVASTAVAVCLLFTAFRPRAGGALRLPSLLSLGGSYMYRGIFALALVVGFVSARSTSAAVISRDWKTPGDGLLTFDDVNQREWLDLSETLLSSQFPGDGSTPLEVRESRYQYVVSQTAAGGLFEGFTVARSADVRALAESAGIDTSTSNGAINSDPTLQLSELLGLNFVGASVDGQPGRTGSVGLLDEVIGNPPSRLNGLLLNGQSFAGLRIGTHHVELPMSITPGVMLFRVVPEPDAVALTSVAVCLFLAAFRPRAGGALRLPSLLSLGGSYMYRGTFALALVVGFVSARSTPAAVISRDWKTPGDGLLTYDDVNRREWLDLSQTDLFQFPDFTPAETFAYVQQQTATGGVFAGFAIAKSNDVLALAVSSGIDISSLDFATNEVAAGTMAALLGITDFIDDHQFFAVGYLDEVAGPPFFLPRGAVFFVDSSKQAAGLQIGDNDALIHPHNGVMLYRNVVPEPSSELISFFGMLAAALFFQSAERVCREPFRFVSWRTGKIKGPASTSR